MATKKIGKLTYKFSPDGLLFRWGDEGEVKRVNLGPLNKLMDRDSGNDNRYPDDGYDDRYEDDRGYDEEYDDRYDDGYRGYDDRRDDRYDDRYDDGYGYDDRRGDRYDSYDDEPYYEPGYDDEPAPSRLDVIWDLLDRYPWIVYVLLVLLPPLGIYLLWRKGMFDFTIRTAISVVSGIWFVVLIIWLISAMTGGAGDITRPGPTSGINLASPTATIVPAASENPLADPTSEPSAEPSVCRKEAPLPLPPRW